MLEAELEKIPEGTILQITTFNKEQSNIKLLLVLKLENNVPYFIELNEYDDENFTYDSDENLILLQDNEPYHIIPKNHYQELTNESNEDYFEKHIKVFMIFENEYQQKTRWYLNELISSNNLKQQFYFLSAIEPEQLETLEENLKKYQNLYSSKLFDETDLNFNKEKQ